MRYVTKPSLENIEADARRIADAAFSAASPGERDIFTETAAENFEAMLAAFRDNEEKCQKVLRFFNDEESKIEYVREIVFKLFQKSFGPLFAVAHTDGMTFDYIDSYNVVVEKALKEGSLPNLYNTSNAGLYQFLKTTYIFEQYKHAPQVVVRPGDVFLDCGACFGDVGLWAVQCGAKKVYAFEPEPENFSFLERNIEKFAVPGTIEPVKLAFGQEKGFLNFTSNTSSSRFTRDGEIRVEVSTMDLWRQERGVRPDFIKMDIEGAEPASIAGGRQTIEEFRPRLAISIYHNFSDLWTLPLMIKDYCKDYVFYCKKHHPIHECILYAK